MNKRHEMKSKFENVAVAGSIDTELCEIQKLDNYDGDITPYATWSRACSAFFTLFCC